MATSSRKYPYPSDVRVEEFVFAKLNEFNHSIWKPMILNLIRNHGLMGFIDGTTPVPQPTITVTDEAGARKEIDNPDFKEWIETNELVRRWILQSLNEDILARVINIRIARDLWQIFNDAPLNKRIFLQTSKDVAGRDLSIYLPLYRAILDGDSTTAEEIFKKDPEAVRAVITGASETALHVAVRTVRRFHLLKKLLDMLSPQDLVAQDMTGNTALHIAAEARNIEAAMWLVNKNPLLPGILNNFMGLPVHGAAACGDRKMIEYLLTVMKSDMQTRPFEGEQGVNLVQLLTANGLYDIVLSLLQKYPSLALADHSPLVSIAMKKAAFLGGTHFNYWQHLVYSYVPITATNLATKGKIENQVGSFSSARKYCSALFWELALILLPQVKQIRNTKLKHHQALELVKHLCKEIANLEPEKAAFTFGYVVMAAAIGGTGEVLEQVLASFPSSIYFRSATGQSIFQTAIVRRNEKVFNLIYQVDSSVNFILSTTDALMNNAMHLVGYLESEYLVGSLPPQKLYLRSTASGAALQMQRELQWFKEVEKLSLPHDKEARNSTGKTAEMIFKEMHEELAKEGEQWMKDRANSCTIVATLVATIVFAAAITVPGGNNSNTGLPMFSKQPAFLIFAVSDALALFTSTSSMLMFLGILTSRYALEDFLFSLPKRLIIGLVTLFLSMVFMMVAFSSIVYLVFGDQKVWVLALVSGSSAITLILFASLQFRPLLDIVNSTYGSGIFGRQSKHIIY